MKVTIYKRVLSAIAIILVAVLFSQFGTPTVVAVANNSENDSSLDADSSGINSIGSYGLLPEIIDETKAAGPGNMLYSPGDTLPSSYDITTSRTARFVPAIGSQGGLASCTSFAVGYYAFTYTANKLNGITTTAANTYSPKWVYNALNEYSVDKEPVDLRTGIVQNISFITEHGLLKQSDFPYVGNSGTLANYTELPSSALSSQMMNALKTRISSYCYYTTDTSNQDLKEIKSQLAAGNMLIVSTFIEDSNARYCADLGQYVVTRVNRNDSYHCVVVVGYDDTVWVDVNGNGKPNNGEYGAFKIANSWGNKHIVNENGVWGNGSTGYYWVAYDALLESSALSGWEDNLTTIRVPAFQDYNEGEYGKNIFYKIEVENYDVFYAAKLTLTAADRSKLSVQISKNTSSGTSTTLATYPNSRSGSLPCNDLVIFYDLGASAANITTLSTYSTRVGTTNNTSYSSSTDFVDSNRNEIRTFPPIAGNGDAAPASIYTIVTKAVRYVMGDVNYNGSLDSADPTLILQYISGQRSFSSLQFFLADRNGDGVVNTADASGYLEDLS